MPTSPDKRPVQKKPRRYGIKNPAIYAGTIIVLVLIAIAFLVFPIGVGAPNISKNGGSVSFGKYAGKPIEVSGNSYFAKQVEQRRDRFLSQGLNSQNYSLFDYQVYRSAFEDTVFRMGILDLVHRTGRIITEDRIDEEIAKLPQYQANGAFSPKLYREESLANKIALRLDLRDNLLYESYVNHFVGLSPSTDEKTFVAAMAKQQRKIDLVALGYALYPDTEVSAWAKSHAELFAKLSLSSITVATKADAARILALAKANPAKFPELAKANSKDSAASEGGVIPAKSYFEFENSIKEVKNAQTLKILKKGELSVAMETPQGSWIFYMANADQVIPDLSTTESIAEVRQYMVQKEKGTIEAWLIIKANDIAKQARQAGANGFAAAAKSAKLTVHSLGPFPINYKDLKISYNGNSVPLFPPVSSSTVSEMSGAGNSEAFITKVFSLKLDDIGEAMPIDNNVVIFKVTEIKDVADPEPLIDSYMSSFETAQFSNELGESFLKGKKLEDNFSQIYSAYLSPKQGNAQ